MVADLFNGESLSSAVLSPIAAEGIQCYAEAHPINENGKEQGQYHTRGFLVPRNELEANHSSTERILQAIRAWFEDPLGAVFPTTFSLPIEAITRYKQGQTSRLEIPMEEINYPEYHNGQLLLFEMEPGGSLRWLHDRIQHEIQNMPSDQTEPTVIELQDFTFNHQFNFNLQNLYWESFDGLVVPGFVGVLAANPRVTLYPGGTWELQATISHPTEDTFDFHLVPPDDPTLSKRQAVFGGEGRGSFGDFMNDVAMNIDGKPFVMKITGAVPNFTLASGTVESDSGELAYQSPPIKHSLAKTVKKGNS